MTEFRIVTDEYCGFEVQLRRWWFPVWMQAGFNTHRSAEEAESWARRKYGDKRVVKYIGHLKPNAR